ncbi:MAG: hypothetical protein PGN08_12030 [Sphingomonas taxi]
MTGGTSGMGLASAKRIVAEGGTVIVTGLNPYRISNTQRSAERDMLGRCDGDPGAWRAAHISSATA